MHHSIAYRGWTFLWLTRHDTKKLRITIKLKLEARKAQKRDTGCCPCWAKKIHSTKDQQVGEGAKNPLNYVSLPDFQAVGQYLWYRGGSSDLVKLTLSGRRS